MKKIFLAAFVAFSSIAFTSCGDSDNDSSASSPVLLKKVIMTYDDGEVDTRNLTYSGSKLVSLVSTSGFRETYTYTGDNLTSVKTYDGSDLMEEHLLTYNSSNVLTTSTVLNYDAGYSKQVSYTYASSTRVTTTEGYSSATSNPIFELEGTGVMSLDSEGNVISYVYTPYSGGSSTTLNTYDDKHNPMKNVIGTKAYGMSYLDAYTHNLLTYHSPDEDYTYSYTYNSDGYPVTVNADEGWDTYNAQYFY